MKILLLFIILCSCGKKESTKQESLIDPNILNKEKYDEIMSKINVDKIFDKTAMDKFKSRYSNFLKYRKLCANEVNNSVLDKWYRIEDGIYIEYDLSEVKFNETQEYGQVLVYNGKKVPCSLTIRITGNEEEAEYDFEYKDQIYKTNTDEDNLCRYLSLQKGTIQKDCGYLTVSDEVFKTTNYYLPVISK